MLLLDVDKLPKGERRAYELKLDGFRALAIKARGKIQLRSRNEKNFNDRYPAIAKALEALPDDTAADIPNRRIRTRFDPRS